MGQRHQGPSEHGADLSQAGSGAAAPAAAPPGTRRAGGLFLAGLAGLAVFHVLVLAGALPRSMVWGGRVAEDPAGLLALELFALGLLLVFGVVVALRAGLLGRVSSARPVRIAAWVVVAWFLLNVPANLTSPHPVEKLVFTPVALVLAALGWKVARAP